MTDHLDLMRANAATRRSRNVHRGAIRVPVATGHRFGHEMIDHLVPDLFAVDLHVTATKADVATAVHHGAILRRAAMPVANAHAAPLTDLLDPNETSGLPTVRESHSTAMNDPVSPLTGMSDLVSPSIVKVAPAPLLTEMTGPVKASIGHVPTQTARQDLLIATTVHVKLSTGHVRVQTAPAVHLTEKTGRARASTVMSDRANL
jgi:hypothetical protein